MKKSNLFLSLLVAITVIAFTSCKEDEPIIDIEEGIPVADGFYLAVVGEDPVSAAQLTASKVDAEGYAAMERTGFVQAYVYLTAGSYNLVEVADKAIVNTYGGTMTTVTGDDDHNKECDESGYSLVDAVVDGAAFSVATEGFYVVAYDATMGEIVYDQLTSVGIIGDAVEGIGWDGDAELTGSVTADGGSWTGEDIVLKPGVFKFRYNCRWAIDRRINHLDPFHNDNGYSFFTNYSGDGGSIDQLVEGNVGDNIPVTERALFDVTFTWDPDAGVSATITRAGDAPALTFDPAEWAWGTIGNGTAQNWDADMDFHYGGEGAGTYTWHTVVTFEADSLFKFRTNDSWDDNLGGTLTTTESALTFGGADMATPGNGDYYIKLETSDDGVSWTATMTENGWGIIGTGSPQGNWDADIDMTPAIVDGKETYTLTGDFTTDGWKFRANDGWDYNLGGEASGLTAGGGDIFLAEAGNYTIVLTYDGTTYTYTATKN